MRQAEARRRRTLRRAGAGPLAALTLAAAPAAAADLRHSLEAGWHHDDNVGRALGTAAPIADHSLRVALGSRWRADLHPHLRLVLAAGLSGEKFQHVEGLDRVGVDATATLRYRADAGYRTPTWSVFVRAARDDYASALRDGTRWVAGASVRQPITDRLEVALGLQTTRREARSGVFDGADRALRLDLDWMPADHHALRLGTEARRGDLVSTGAPRQWVGGVRGEWVRDDALSGDRPLWAYRFRGDTVIASAGWNWNFTPGQSFDLAVSRARSRAESAPASGGAGYIATRVDLAWLLLF